jgi:hypothetical protein
VESKNEFIFISVCVWIRGRCKWRWVRKGTKRNISVGKGRRMAQQRSIEVPFLLDFDFDFLHWLGLFFSIRLWWIGEIFFFFTCLDVRQPYIKGWDSSCFEFFGEVGGMYLSR